MFLIKSQEHEVLSLNSLSAELKDQVSALHFSQYGYMQKPRFLGLEWDSEDSLRCGYYIGASWLIEGEVAVAVTPKEMVRDIDFVEMFMTALAVDTDPEASYFSKCYGIEFDSPRIEVPQELCQVTPLILLHYITLLENLVKRGLKKGYKSQEENLNSKVRGQIYVPAHIQQNICNQREDRAYCRYQEYTEDILENRLLKKALNFAYRSICSYKSFERKRVELQSRLNRLFAAFVSVSDQVEVHQVARVSQNKLFRHYVDAVRVAKMILRHFDNSITYLDEESKETPPYWIDMPRLFELYVFSKLSKTYPNQILFQEKGFAGRCDFLKIANEGTSEKLIMDAKYKPYYEGDTPVAWEDIQEISGYARDKKLLETLGWLKDSVVDTQNVPPCVVIYPEYGEKEDSFDQESLLKNAQQVNQYTNFYKIAVKVPRV